MTIRIHRFRFGNRQCRAATGSQLPVDVLAFAPAIQVSLIHACTM